MAAATATTPPNASSLKEYPIGRSRNDFYIASFPFLYLYPAIASFV